MDPTLLRQTVVHYKGRPIPDLSKDELITALTEAYQEIEYQRERANRYMQIAVSPS